MRTVTLHKCFVFTTKSKRIYIQGYIQDAHVSMEVREPKRKSPARGKLELVGLLTEVCLIFRGRIHFVPGLGV